MDNGQNGQNGQAMVVAGREAQHQNVGMVIPEFDASDFQTLSTITAAKGKDREKLKAEAGFKSMEFRKLENVGDVIAGFLVGRGRTQVTNPSTGELGEIGTWSIMTSPNKIETILSTSQLESRLSGVSPGARVIIEKLAKVKSGRGRNVSEFKIDVG